MKRNSTGKYLSIFISVLSLSVMFIASSIGANAHASEYVDIKTDVDFNLVDIDVDGSGHVYVIDWFSRSNSMNITRMDSDLANTEVLCIVDHLWTFAVDDANQYIYIVNDPGDGSYIIQRMNIDGTALTPFTTTLEYVNCIAAGDAGRVYVGASGVGIVRIEQSGTDISTILSVTKPYEYITRIAVDNVNGYIYYIEQTGRISPGTAKRTLYRMNIDGSGEPITLASSAGGALRDVAVDANGYVYYIVSNDVIKIDRAELNSETLTNNFHGGYIAVDENGCVYVTESHSTDDQAIHKIMTVEQFITQNIDKGNIEDIGTSLVSKFDNFSASLDKGNKAAAVNQLNAFINEVSAQRGKKIAEDVADILIAKAQTLLANIEESASQ